MENFLNEYYVRCSNQFGDKQKRKMDHYQSKYIPYLAPEYPTRNSAIKIKRDNILNFLDEAIEQEQLLINSQSFYIYDLSHEKSTDFNTIVFQIHGCPLKSMENTTKIMERFFEYKNVPYRSIQILGKLLGIGQKCPYVLGPYFFAPDRGTAKNHANWIAWHHVNRAGAKEKQTLLNIDPYHELILDQDMQKVEKMIDKVNRLFQAQQIMINEWQEAFNQHHEVNLKQNIIYKRSSEETNLLKIPTLTSCLVYLISLQAHEMVTHVFEEGDPYLEEIREHFPHLDEPRKVYSFYPIFKEREYEYLFQDNYSPHFLFD